MTFQMYCFTKEQNNLVKEMIIYNGEAEEQKNLIIYGSTEVLLHPNSQLIIEGVNWLIDGAEWSTGDIFRKTKGLRDSTNGRVAGFHCSGYVLRV